MPTDWQNLIHHMLKNYYEILGVEISSTKEEIKRAFRLKAIQFHPDKHFGDHFFSEKFVEATEAYELLSDESKRELYDIDYRKLFVRDLVALKKEKEEKANKEDENNKKYQYDPNKPFYSIFDRMDQNTPQFRPIRNHWGESIAEDADFFCMPKHIGKIISGYTTLRKDEHPSKNFWGKVNFSHSCSYMGVNGFAEYHCDKSRDNIKSFELNFNNVTDLMSAFMSVNSATAVLFNWVNNNKMIIEHYTKFQNTGKQPPRSDFVFWTNSLAEKYWTLYLLDNMDNKLQKDGYLEFSMGILEDDNNNETFVKGPLLKLGIGYITIYVKTGNITYQFNDIKRVYLKSDGNLYIEHKNFEKKRFSADSGNINSIPISLLLNKQYFIKAFELLLGFKLSHDTNAVLHK